MAKFQTQAYTGKKPIVLPESAAPQWCAVDVEFNAGTAASPAYIGNDLIQTCVIPAGHKVLDWFLNFPDIDSNGTPTLAWSLGLSNATLAVPTSTDIGAEVWGSALTAGQAAAIVRNSTNVSAQGQIVDTATLSGNREVVLKCTTAAATYAGAGKMGQLVMLLQG